MSAMHADFSGKHLECATKQKETSINVSVRNGSKGPRRTGRLRRSRGRGLRRSGRILTRTHKCRMRRSVIGLYMAVYFLSVAFHMEFIYGSDFYSWISCLVSHLSPQYLFHTNLVILLCINDAVRSFTVIGHSGRSPPQQIISCKIPNNCSKLLTRVHLHKTASWETQSLSL